VDVMLTAKIEQPIDGNNVYGFPLIFYTEFSMEVAPPLEPPYFNFLNLMIDLLPVIILAILLERIALTVIKKGKSRSIIQ
jgi:magnesium-transporting ATPase (P-type)